MTPDDALPIVGLGPIFGVQLQVRSASFRSAAVTLLDCPSHLVPHSPLRRGWGFCPSRGGLSFSPMTIARVEAPAAHRGGRNV